SAVHLHIVESNIAGLLHREALLGIEVKIGKRDVFNRHFDQAIEQASLVALGRDVAEMDVAEARRALAHRLGRRLVVLHIEHDNLVADIFHHHVINPNILHHTAAPAGRFDANTAVSTVENAVRNRDFLHPTRHFRANHHSAVPAQHGAVSDGVVFGRHVHFASRLILARLDGNAVVTHADVAVRDVHVAARFGVNSVGIRRLRVVNRHARHGHVFAKLGVHRPKGRVSNGDAFDKHVFTKHGLNKRRPQEAALHHAGHVGLEQFERLRVLPAKLLLPLRVLLA
nr:hypothetical protein [Tanacetum cinerariifolium]